MKSIHPTKPIARFAALLFAASASIYMNRAAARPIDAGADSTIELVVMVEGELGGDPSIGAGLIFGHYADQVYVVTANHVVRRGVEQAQHVRILLKRQPDRGL